MSYVFFCFEIPCTLLKKWAEKFQKQYQNQQTTTCQSVHNFKLSYYISYAVANVYEIVMSCGVYIIV